MNKLSTAALVALAACSSAQPRPEPVAQPAPAPAVAAPAPTPVVDDGFRLEYRPQAEGRTLVEVTEPAGADVIIWDAGTQVAHDKAPVSVDAAADKYYRVEVRLPSGEMKEKKVAAHSGQIASVRVEVAAAAGPQAMAVPAFRGLIQQVDESPGDQAKMAVLKTALAYNWITTKMAIIVLDHITYRQSKLDIVPLLRDRILDRESSYLLVNHFTYREDKAKVQELLLH
jgi:Domain of unknown function (DUF4476)